MARGGVVILSTLSINTKVIALSTLSGEGPKAIRSRGQSRPEDGGQSAEAEVRQLTYLIADRVNGL